MTITTGTIEIKMPKWIIGAVILLIVIIVALISLLVHQKRAYKEISQLYVTAQDSMKTYRNKLGQSVSTISVLQATNQKYFIDMQTKDAQIIHLQQLVKDEANKRREVEAALTFTTQAHYKIADSLKNKIVSLDSQVINGQKTFFPVYMKDITDQWISGNVTMGRTIFKLNLSVKDSLDAVIGMEPDGWFKRKPYAEITNLNPYSQTTSMRAYQKTSIPNKPLKTGIIVGTIGFIAGVLVHLL